jgi:hypothetical protein
LRRIDFLGSALLIVAIASLMFGLDRGSNVSWTTPATWVSFLVCVVATTAFFYVESHVAKEPIVAPSVVFNSRLVPIYTASIFCFSAISSLEYALPLYYQARDGLSTTRASLYLVPGIVTGVSSALSCGVWMRKTGQYFYALMFAFFMQTLGGVITVLMSGTVLTSTFGVIVGHVVTELGVGNFVVSALIAVIANSPKEDTSTATALYFSVRNLGSVVGVSATSSTIQLVLRKLLVAELQNFDIDVDEVINEVRRSLDSLRDLDPKVTAIVRQCYGLAINKGYLLILALAAGAMLAGFTLRGGRERRK